MAVHEGRVNGPCAPATHRWLLLLTIGTLVSALMLRLVMGCIDPASCTGNVCAFEDCTVPEGEIITFTIDSRQTTSVIFRNISWSGGGLLIEGEENVKFTASLAFYKCSFTAMTESVALVRAPLPLSSLSLIVEDSIIEVNGTGASVLSVASSTAPLLTDIHEVSFVVRNSIVNVEGSATSDGAVGIASLLLPHTITAIKNVLWLIDNSTLRASEGRHSAVAGVLFDTYTENINTSINNLSIAFLRSNVDVGAQQITAVAGIVAKAPKASLSISASAFRANESNIVVHSHDDYAVALALAVCDAGDSDLTVESFITTLFNCTISVNANGENAMAGGIMANPSATSKLHASSYVFSIIDSSLTATAGSRGAVVLSFYSTGPQFINMKAVGVNVTVVASIVTARVLGTAGEHALSLVWGGLISGSGISEVLCEQFLISVSDSQVLSGCAEAYPLVISFAASGAPGTLEASAMRIEVIRSTLSSSGCVLCWLTISGGVFTEMSRLRLAGNDVSAAISDSHITVNASRVGLALAFYSFALLDTNASLINIRLYVTGSSVIDVRCSATIAAALVVWCTGDPSSVVSVRSAHLMIVEAVANVTDASNANGVAAAAAIVADISSGQGLLHCDHINMTILSSTVHVSAPEVSTFGALATIANMAGTGPRKEAPLNVSTVRFAVCSSMLSSVDVAFDIVIAEGGVMQPFLGKLQVDHWVVHFISSTLVALHGLCLTYLPVSASPHVPSVLRDSRLRCTVVGNESALAMPSQALFLTNVTDSSGASLAGKFRDAIVGYAAVPSSASVPHLEFIGPLCPLPDLNQCHILEMATQMQGVFYFKNCTIVGRTSDIVTVPGSFLDITLQNISWSRGSLNIVSINSSLLANIHARIQNSTFLDMSNGVLCLVQHITVPGRMSNISIEIVNSIIHGGSSQPASVASFIGYFNEGEDLRVRVSNSDIVAGSSGSTIAYSRRGCASIISHHTASIMLQNVSLFVHGSKVLLRGHHYLGVAGITWDGNGVVQSHNISLLLHKSDTTVLGGKQITVAGWVTRCWGGNGALLNISSANITIEDSNVHVNATQNAVALAGWTMSGEAGAVSVQAWGLRVAARSSTLDVSAPGGVAVILGAVLVSGEVPSIELDRASFIVVSCTVAVDAVGGPPTVAVGTGAFTNQELPQPTFNLTHGKNVSFRVCSSFILANDVALDVVAFSGFRDLPDGTSWRFISNAPVAVTSPQVSAFDNVINVTRQDSPSSCLTEILRLASPSEPSALSYLRIFCARFGNRGYALSPGAFFMRNVLNMSVGHLLSEADVFATSPFPGDHSHLVPRFDQGQCTFRLLSETLSRTVTVSTSPSASTTRSPTSAASPSSSLSKRTQSESPSHSLTTIVRTSTRTVSGSRTSSRGGSVSGTLIRWGNSATPTLIQRNSATATLLPHQQQKCDTSSPAIPGSRVFNDSISEALLSRHGGVRIVVEVPFGWAPHRGTFTVLLRHVSIAGLRSEPRGVAYFEQSAAATGVLSRLMNSTAIVVTIKRLVSYNIFADEQIRLVAARSDILGPPCVHEDLVIEIGTFNVAADPQPALDATRTAAEVTSLAAMALTGGRAGADQQALAIAGMMPCASPAERRATQSVRLLAPLALTNDMMGVLSGNLLLIGGVCILNLVAAGAVCAVARCTWSTALAKVRFPSLPFRVFVVAFPGTVFAGVFLLRTSTDTHELASAWCALLLCFPAVVAVFLITKTRIAMSYAFYDLSQLAEHSSIPHWLADFFLPRGQWSPEPQRHRFGGWVTFLGRPEHLWVTFSFWSPALLAIAGAIPHCGVVYYLSGAAHIVIALAVFLLQPHRVRAANVGAGVANCMFASFLFLSAQQVSEVSGSNVAAVAAISQAQTALTIVRLILAGFSVVQERRLMQCLSTKSGFEWTVDRGVVHDSATVRKREFNAVDELAGNEAAEPMLAVAAASYDGQEDPELNPEADFKAPKRRAISTKFGDAHLLHEEITTGLQQGVCALEQRKDQQKKESDTRDGRSPDLLDMLDIL